MNISSVIKPFLKKKKKAFDEMKHHTNSVCTLLEYITIIIVYILVHIVYNMSYIVLIYILVLVKKHEYWRIMKLCPTIFFFICVI